MFLYTVKYWNIKIVIHENWYLYLVFINGQKENEVRSPVKLSILISSNGHDTKGDKSPLNFFINITQMDKRPMVLDFH